MAKEKITRFAKTIASLKAIPMLNLKEMRKTCNTETRVGRQAPAFLITLSTQHALVFWFLYYKDITKDYLLKKTTLKKVHFNKVIRQRPLIDVLFDFSEI